MHKMKKKSRSTRYISNLIITLQDRTDGIP
jgi:hypothetical protein